MKWLIKPIAVFIGLLVVSNAHTAETPTSNGVISNPTLVANSAVAKAQAVGAITAFMSEGAQKCDDKGQNCHSLFGQDDTPDYAGLQQQSQALSGIQSFGFMDPDGNASSISAQTGTLAIACGDTKVQQVSGVAIKFSECTVGANGDARVKFQVCTAPSRSLPVTQPDNAVDCSKDPTAANFTAPAGKVCKVAACDTEPVNSLNGWSTEYTANWVATMPSSATADQKSRNGLAMVFYPALSSSVPPDFKADSDNMTAVKVVQSFVNNDTNKTAVGMRIAYRHKATVTKAMMEAGTGSVPNPEDHTQQWETLKKLQANALVPQYAAKYGQNGAECIQQINNGIGETGTIFVCDQTYTNESGIKPLAKSAQIAVEGENCGTTEVCVQKVVNTNTWKQSCQEDVPLSMRNCTTKTDYTTEEITSTRTKPTEICTEKRTSQTYSCSTQAVLVGATPRSCPAGTRLVNTSRYIGPYNDPYALLRVTCMANDQLRIQWSSSVSGTEFDNAKVYGYTWMSVDVVANLKAFQSAPWTKAGYVCLPQYANGLYNYFRITCDNDSCLYEVKTTRGGDCGWSNLAPLTSGSANISFDAIFNKLDACTTYEAATIN